MAASRYEQYIVRKPAIITQVTTGRISIEVPTGDKIPAKSNVDTGPLVIFSDDFLKEATSKVEYGFITGDTEIGTGKYDALISEVSVKAVNTILKDEELKRIVSGTLSSYAKSFADRVESYLKTIGEKYGINPDQYGQSQGAGFNPMELLKVLMGGG